MVNSFHSSALLQTTIERERGRFFSLRSFLSCTALLPVPLRAWPRARRRAPGAPALSLALERRGREKKKSSSLKSKSPNLSAFGPLQMQRVKLYRLNPEGLWDDKGTGSVSIQHLVVWVEKRRAERLDERTDRLTSSVAVEFAVSSIFFFLHRFDRGRARATRSLVCSPLCSSVDAPERRGTRAPNADKQERCDA